MSPIDRAFNVLMWIIIGAIAFTLFVPGGKNFLAVFQTAWAGFNGSLSIITGQSNAYTGGK